ncbi:hypothetical protein IFR05_002465 [Cadophora sp. M221]|nr:hypothetical protein IFR05_002465 [Cadophora sp. M221]
MPQISSSNEAPAANSKAAETTNMSKLPAWAEVSKEIDTRAQPWKQLLRTEDAKFADGPDKMVIPKGGQEAVAAMFEGSLAG